MLVIHLCILGGIIFALMTGWALAHDDGLGGANDGARFFQIMFFGVSAGMLNMYGITGHTLIMRDLIYIPFAFILLAIFTTSGIWLEKKRAGQKRRFAKS
jgi:hypothetical protein